MRRRHLPLSRLAAIAATVTLVTFARIPDGDDDGGGVRRRTVYYVAARGHVVSRVERRRRAPPRRHRSVARPPARRFLVAAPCVRTYARTHIPACLASSSAKMVDVSLPRASSRQQIAPLLLLSIFLSPSLFRLGPASRMIGAAQKGGKSRRRRARNVAVVARWRSSARRSTSGRDVVVDGRVRESRARRTYVRRRRRCGDGKMAGNLNETMASVQRSPIILSRERRNYRAVPCRVVSASLSSTVTVNSGIISRRARLRNKAFSQCIDIYVTRVRTYESCTYVCICACI